MLPRAALTLFSLAVFACSVSAYPVYCQITAITPGEHSLKIGCRMGLVENPGQVELRFRDRFAGIDGLSRRITAFRATDATDAAGERLPVELPGSGIYRVRTGTRSELRIEFIVHTDMVPGAASDPGRYALVSSLGASGGALLLADLLPEMALPGSDKGSMPIVRLKITPPDGWQVSTTEREQFGTYDVPEIDKAIFIVGRLRTNVVNVDRTRIEVSVAGEMVISDLQVNLLVSALAKEHMRIMAEVRRSRYVVTLLPFPVPVTGLRSAALTRGSTVLMLLNPDLDAGRTLRLYQRHLAHELLHFYLPESFNIRENFDWFWEGFIRYTGLLSLNRIGAISAREILDEMENEYTAYRSNRLRGNVSLVAASPLKFASTATYDLIYHKGTLIAWLYDMELRRQRGGKASIADVLAGLYREYGHSDSSVGNSEILTLLRKAGKFDKFIQDYVEGTREIDLAEIVKVHGLEVENRQGRTRIQVAPRLSAKQRMILAQLGQADPK